MRLDADLNNMRWKIRPEEVLLEVGKSYGSKIGLQKITDVDFYTVNHNTFSVCELVHEQVTFQSFGLRSGRASITSSNSLLPSQVFTTVGIYKGSRVAIKKVTKKKVDINKKLLWEIKQVRKSPESPEGCRYVSTTLAT